MRKIAATYISPVTRPPVKNGILILEDDGTVVDVHEPGGNIKEEAGVEFYSGILVPGFINAHCHLEFSHLHNKIPEKTGLGDFIGRINRLRHSNEEEVQKAMDVADRKMWAAGIAAVGDVSNSASSVRTKLKSRIKYHTFVETFGFHPSRAERAFEIASSVKAAFDSVRLPSSVVPHSPYSVSEPLFRKIQNRALTEKSILSIHILESEAEQQFFKYGSGPLADHIQKNLGIDISHWHPGGKSSLQTVLEFLPPENQLLLVHNTFSNEEDIEALETMRSKETTYLVLCPNSNLYIEDTLPPVGLFRRHKLKLCFGADSLASNHQLSVLHEMITLQKYFPEMELEELLKTACWNGACALGLQNEYGSFEPGKKPGVNLISGLDLKNLKLTEKTRVKRLL